VKNNKVSIPIFFILRAMRKFFCFVSLLFWIQTIAQSESEFVANPLSFYQQTIGSSSDPIYIGEIDPLLIKSRSSHPFYLQRAWENMDIVFNGIEYEGVYALFNLVKQELLLKHPDKLKKTGVIVNMPLLKEFSYQEHTFRRSPYSSSADFYEVLMDGKHFDLLSKRIKTEEVTAEGITYEQSSEYFLEFEKKLIILKGKKSLKDSFSDYKEIDRKIKSQDGFRFSRYNEDKMIKYIKAFDENVNY